LPISMKLWPLSNGPSVSEEAGDLLIRAQSQAMSREWNAAAYERLSGPQLSWGKKVLERVHLRGDETVLDAGCGTGGLTVELISALPRGGVIAVDLSQNMLNKARDRLAAEFRHRVRLVACDLKELPFSNAFDVIFSTAAFHWVLDHDALFRSLRMALHPGGSLIAQCGGGPNLARLRERAKQLASTEPYRQFLGGYQEPWFYSDAPSATERLRRAGFIRVETSTEPALTVLSDADHYRDFVRNVILHRHLERLPDAAMRDAFVDSLAQQAATDDPPYSLDYWRLNLRGELPL
jgi:trans-aconitate 2-methyltransferase